MSRSRASKIFGIIRIGLLTAALATNTFALIIGVTATNPITAGVAEAIIVGTVVYGLTKLNENEKEKNAWFHNPGTPYVRILRSEMAKPSGESVIRPSRVGHTDKNETEN